MSEQTPTTQTPEPNPARKTPSRKVSDRKGEKFSDLPPGVRKERLVKSLQKTGSTSASSSRTFTDLATRLGWEAREVYGLVNGTSGKAGSSPTCLVATGHVKVVTTEEGLSVHLTAKGLKADFSGMPFSRNGKSK